MMEKPGAAVFVWTNVAEASEDQLNEWYVRDHLEERVSIPGFVRARRFIAVEAKRKYLALYETRSTSILIGPDYLASINNPRPMTIAMIRKFSDTARVISHIRGRFGDDGGFIATLTIEVPEAARAALGEALAGVDVERLATRSGVVGAGLMEEDVVISRQTNAGKQLRPTEDGRADWILTIEGFDAGAVKAACEAFLGQVSLPPGSVTETSLYRFICGKNAMAA